MKTQRLWMVEYFIFANASTPAYMAADNEETAKNYAIGCEGKVVGLFVPEASIAELTAELDGRRSIMADERVAAFLRSRFVGLNDGSILASCSGDAVATVPSAAGDAYLMVPREPTGAMIDAAEAEDKRQYSSFLSGRASVEQIYRVMIAAFYPPASLPDKSAVTDVHWTVRDLLEQVPALQSLRDRWINLIRSQNWGDQLDGDMDTLRDVIAAIKRLERARTAPAASEQCHESDPPDDAPMLAEGTRIERQVTCEEGVKAWRELTDDDSVESLRVELAGAVARGLAILEHKNQMTLRLRTEVEELRKAVTFGPEDLEIMLAWCDRNRFSRDADDKALRSKIMRGLGK